MFSKVMTSAALAAALVFSVSAAKADQQVTLEAVIAQGAPTINDALTFSVTPKNGNLLEGGNLVLARSPSTVTLPEGEYTVTASYGATNVRSDLVVGAAPVRHVVDLDSGWIRLAVIPHLGAAPLTSTTNYRILTYGRNAYGDRMVVATTSGVEPELILPRGYYVVEADAGDTVVTHTIEVTPGATYRYTLNLNAGSVNTQVVGANAGESIVWEIYWAGEAGVEEPLVSRTTDMANFTLREGTYTVIANQGDRQARQDVVVTPGSARTVNLTFQ